MSYSQLCGDGKINLNGHARKKGAKKSRIRSKETTKQRMEEMSGVSEFCLSSLGSPTIPSFVDAPEGYWIMTSPRGGRRGG